MAMNVFSVFRNSKVRTGAFVSIALFLTATTTQAGFEWVPAEPKAAPAPAVEAAPVQPPAQDLLMHAPQPLSPLPTADKVEPEKVEPVVESAAMPPKMENESIVEKQPQPVIRVKKMTPLPVPVEAAPVMAEKTMDADALKTPPTTRVILPEDAPDSARTVPESEILQINPFPSGTDNTMPVTPIEEAAAPSEAVEDAVGFGTDMPLALALQQIAPAGYAFSFGEDINPGAKVSWTGGKAWTEVMQDMIAPLDLQASVRGKAILIHNQKQSFVAPVAEPAIEVANADVEPSAGKNATEPPMALDKEEAPEIRRSIIHDPGMAPQEQPKETLSAIEELPAPVPPAPSAPEKQSGIWEAEKGDSLKQTLSNWSKKGDFALEWNALHDYTLQSDILVAGKVDRALKTLLVNGIDSEKGPMLTYVNNPGNTNAAKLVIDDRKNSKS